MKGYLSALSIFCVLFMTCAVSNVSATPTGQDRDYSGGGKGAVVFSYETHAREGGYVCSDCHSTKANEALFAPKRYSFTFKDHNSGKYCWACHDGKTAEKRCDSCHYK